MNNEHIPTIHDFDFDRQGPGNEASTLRALQFIEGLSDSSRIADLGCGTGGQTITLARHAPGTITGVDLFPKFIDRLHANAAAFGLQDRVKGLAGDMAEPPFEEGSLDLIWSEGAIYHIGFQRGMKEWRRYLKSGGYIAVTENTWLTDERPKEIADFWNAAYPEIDTIPHKVAQVQAAGYLPVATFVLPETIWTDYYAAQERFLAQHPQPEAFTAAQRYERELYDKYQAYYGYAFYIAQRK